MSTGFNNFWSSVDVEPKRKFRWIMGYNGVPHWIMKKASRPKISLTEAEHDFLNYKFYYPGRVSYDELTMTMADPINPDASLTMYELLQKSGYRTPDKFAQNNLGLGGGDSNDIGVITKKAATSAINGMYLMLLDAEGAPVEEWTFYNAWIKSVDFDELDYTSDDLLNLTITVRYDWASIKSPDKSRVHLAAKSEIGKSRQGVNQGGFTSG
ncbi:MAG TPA: hypothetical protein DCM40_07015 [Maribacter sp.]|nr:hypothetical protein [Maribacter sp.]